MNTQETISSLQNPLVKQILRLQQKQSERSRSGLFVAEGRREVSLALGAGLKCHRLLLCPDIYREDPAYSLGNYLSGQLPVAKVSRQVYNKLAYRRDAEGVVLSGHQRPLSLEQLPLPETPLLLILEGIEKPGNLGAILRTADAAGVHAVILTDSQCDLYNPNTIRASLGCAFTVPVAGCTTDSAIGWLRDKRQWTEKQQPLLFAAVLQTQSKYYQANLSGAVALAFGAEDKGLSEGMRQAAHQLICIPMKGRIDSLNVGASVAILSFEVARQRDTTV